MISKYKLIIYLLFLVTTPCLGGPEITLERPKDDSMTVYKPNVMFKGVVKEGSSLTINGLTIPLNINGQFEYEMKLNSKNGNNYFLIEASNGAETVQVNRTIFYDEKNNDEKKSETPREKVLNQPKTMERIIKEKKQASYSKELSKIDAIDSLRRYIGKNTRGSYAFSEIKLNDFINIFAKEHQVNIINNVDVEKTITVELNDMHPADVFDTLINYWGCHWIMKDQIIRIVEQAPVRVFKLNYLKGSEFISLVSNISDNMTFQTNPIDNSIIAQGPAADLDHIETLMQQLDIKPKQVLIEATIIETNFDISTIIGTKPSSIQRSTGNSSSPFSFQSLGYQFSLSVFENNSNVNILANPQILVTNHKEATINTGNQTGYTTTTVTETSTIENMNFLSTGISLKITPHISNTGEILMDLSPSISEGQINNNKPISSETSTQTQVIIKDGETIVIGGLIQKKKPKSNQKSHFSQMFQF